MKRQSRHIKINLRVVIGLFCVHSWQNISIFEHRKLYKTFKRLWNLITFLWTAHGNTKMYSFRQLNYELYEHVIISFKMFEKLILNLMGCKWPYPNFYFVVIIIYLPYIIYSSMSACIYMQSWDLSVTANETTLQTFCAFGCFRLNSLLHFTTTIHHLKSLSQQQTTYYSNVRTWLNYLYKRFFL